MENVDITLFMIGMLLQWFTAIVPANVREVVRTIAVAIVVGLVIWAIRLAQGNIFGIVLALALGGGGIQLFLTHRKRLLPYLNEFHIVLWNAVFLAVFYTSDIHLSYQPAVLVLTGTTTLYALLPFKPSLELRALMYFYICGLILAVNFILSAQGDPGFLALLRALPHHPLNFILYGAHVCGFLIAFFLLCRLDLYSKYDTAKHRVYRDKEYILMAQRFSAEQISTPLLIGLVIAIAILLWSNAYYVWIPMPTLLFPVVLVCNILANITPQQRED